MARISTILLALIVLMPIRLGAQGRGHYNGGSNGAVRPAPAAPGPVVHNNGGPNGAARPAPAVPGPVVHYGGGPNGFVSPAPAPVFIGRPVPVVPARIVHNPYNPFPAVRHQPVIVAPQPFGIYSPYFWPSPFSVSPYYAVTQPVVQQQALAPEAPVSSQTEVELAYEVGRLSQEIEQLRQQQSSNSLPLVSPAPEPPPVPTTLIFRDGRRIEIQNYVIVGQTLWVVDERTSTKIDISDLDLDATQKENRGRGVRFPLPAR
jgi:hypothetical protein